MANASLVLFFSLVVLTAAKPFNDLAENPQSTGIQYRLPSVYELYDRFPELYSRGQDYPRVLYQPSARIPEEVYNGDILQRQPSEDREVAVIPEERLEQAVTSSVEKSLEPTKPSLDEKEQDKEVPNHEQPEDLVEEPQQRSDDEQQEQPKDDNQNEQPEDPTEQPQQRPDDEQEEPKDDNQNEQPEDPAEEPQQSPDDEQQEQPKDDDRAEPEHNPHPKPNAKPQKPGKDGGRPHGKPQRKQGRGRPFGPRRPQIKPEQKDLAVEAKPSAANPKPETPLVQINIQVASL